MKPAGSLKLPSNYVIWIIVLEPPRPGSDTFALHAHRTEIARELIGRPSCSRLLFLWVDKLI